MFKTKRYWFRYVAVEHQIKRKSGYYLASHRKELLTLLNSLGLEVISCKKAYWKNWNFSVSAIQASRLLQVIAEMLNSGVPILKALRLALSQTRQQSQRMVIEHIELSLLAGKTLSGSLVSFTPLYSELVVSLINVGENTGKMAEMLVKASEMMSKRLELKRRLLKSCSYPAFLLLMSLLVVVTLLTYVVPEFATIIGGLGRDLPSSTVWLLELSNWISEFGLFTFTLFLAVFFVLLLGFKQSKYMQIVLLKLPFLGLCYQQLNTLTISIVSHIMLSSGLSLFHVISSCQSSLNSPLFKEALVITRISLTQGETVTASFKKAGVFPELFLEFVHLGESTGELDVTLKKMAHYYEKRLDDNLSFAIKLIEPSLILILGVMIAFIVLAIYLPILDLGTIG